MLSATMMIVVLGLAAPDARAQLTPPSTAGAKAKPVATIPIRPALQKPEETANGMGQAERLSLQSDLAWVGQYNGAITGDVSERMVNAIKEFQKGRGAKPTGVLNPQERGILADTARKKQESVGWKIVTDPGTGVRLGSRPNWCRSRPATPTAPNGPHRPARSRYNWPAARKPAP